MHEVCGVQSKTYLPFTDFMAWPRLFEIYEMFHRTMASSDILDISAL